jgi:hypothetical protein
MKRKTVTGLLVALISVGCLISKSHADSNWLDCIQDGTGKSGTIANFIAISSEGIGNAYQASIQELTKDCSLSSDNCNSLYTIDQLSKSMLGNYSRVVNNINSDFELDHHGFGSSYIMPAVIVAKLQLAQDSSGDMTFTCINDTSAVSTQLQAKQSQLK